MFENLSERLGQTLRNVSGRGRLTEDNIKETLREVRMALLEADVALPVVKDFVAQVKARAVGTEVTKALKPGQVFIKIVQSELEAVMGEANEKLNLSAQPPAVVLMAGLQGAGKTTSVGKLAKYLTEREKKKVLVVSADVYRPAAIKQLETLADDVSVGFHPSTADQKPIDIVNGAIDAANRYLEKIVTQTGAERLYLLDAEGLTAFLKDKLSAIELPKQIEFRDELPKTNVGKVLRRQLRDQETTHAP